MTTLRVYDGNEYQPVGDLLSDYAHQGNQYRSANFTAAAGWYYLVDLATAAAHLTVTFPASAVAGDRFRVTVAADDLSNGYAVKWDLDGDKLHSGTDDDPWWLFIEGDTIEFVYSGNATFGWFALENGSISPHICVIQRQSDQADVVTGTWTKVELTASLKDNASLGDVSSNYRITIKRDGTYRIFGLAAINNMTTSIWLTGIYKNGVLYRGSASRTGTISGYPTCHSNIVEEFVAGDYFSLYCYHSHGSNRSVYGGSAEYYPTFSLIEIRENK